MSVFEPTPAPQRSPNGTPRSRLGRRALAVVAAPAAAAAIWALEVPVGGARLEVHFGPSGAQVIGIAPILAASVLASLAGWASLEALERRAAQPRRTWTALAAVVLFASLALPLPTAVSLGATIALIGLHLGVGATLIPQLHASAATSTRPRTTPTGHRWSSPTRVAAVLVAGAVITAGALFAAFGPSRFGPSAAGPFGLAARFAPRGAGLAAPGPWAGNGRSAWGGGWRHPSSKDTETFQVVSTNPAGPGSIIITGPVNAGGIEHPGRAIDNATFSDGGFRIDHSSGAPTTHFDTTTCVGTITQFGTFEIIDATGRFAHVGGTGHYIFRATYTTGREASTEGRVTCDPKTMTAYIETIGATVQLTPTVVRQLTTARA